ncbi:hypothetical protein [Nakamurella endophytica]|uniref:Uncharacterized protein n=1 Tax=Nakamurella endophytica TaxID=1748367 RepID=A0A917STW2_9ACTN|nr:hypothetical protein [Nakamurella endophytica]GGL95567.1 hypothetical protein GCM10011594_14010 [Nakamurella endophytica]
MAVAVAVRVPSAAGSEDTALDLVSCDRTGCGQVFRATEGWLGSCPSCGALTDEHDAGLHRRPVADCPLCR